MAFIVSIVIAVVLAIFNKPVRKYRIILYVAVLILDLYICLASYFDYSTFLDDSNQWKNMFTAGILAEGIFLVVAFMGCLPQKWKVTKRLKSIRAEMSVMGCIICIGEMVTYANYFTQLFTLSTGRQIACIATIVLLCLMIPLMLSSFYCVRANMKQSTWKNLQKFAYIFYFALWLHIFGLYANLNGGLDGIFDGKHGDTLLAYTYLWAAYFILRFVKLLYDHFKGRKSYDQIIQDDDNLVPAAAVAAAAGEAPAEPPAGEAPAEDAPAEAEAEAGSGDPPKED